MSVHKKLMEARVKLHSMELKKTGHNKFAGYYYFKLEDFLNQSLTIFNDIGLCEVISYTTDVATMTITDTDDGSTIVITSPMGSANLKGTHEVQNIGAVETYQRRYLWVAAMEIVEEDELDSTTDPRNPPEKLKTKAEQPAEPLPETVGLNDKELDEVTLALSEAMDFDMLKEILRSAWRKATKDQRTMLASQCDAIKAKNKWG